jgi:hypothetical protein
VRRDHAVAATREDRADPVRHGVAIDAEAFAQHLADPQVGQRAAGIVVQAGALGLAHHRDHGLGLDRAAIEQRLERRGIRRPRHRAHMHVHPLYLHPVPPYVPAILGEAARVVKAPPVGAPPC